MNAQKLVIYQLLPRLFGNKNTSMVLNGEREKNGCGKFNDITSRALKSIKDLGVTHVWYTGIIEQAKTKGYKLHNIPDGNPLVIKGKAGSPYAIKDYYDVDPDLAKNVGERMLEFEALVKRTHQNEMKVIIDFVPNHLAREYDSDMLPEGVVDFGVNDDRGKAFSPSNDFYYLPGENLQLSDEIKARYPERNYEEQPAKATGNDHFSNNPGINDWFETVKLNYGVDYSDDHKGYFDPIPDIWQKMKEILLYWVEKGVDGFRCDMAEMVPVAFWHWVIPAVKEQFSDVLFIAEVYNPNLYSPFIEHGKFDFLYDKVGLYDTLRGIVTEKVKTDDLSICWQQLEGIDKYMLRFLENHDEQRIASSTFAGDPFKAIPAMVVATYLHQGPIMLYFGQELGETADGASGYSGDDGRTTIFDYWHVPSIQRWMNNSLFDGGHLSEEEKLLRLSYASVLKLTNEPAIAQGKFYDIMWQNENASRLSGDRVYAFIRFCDVQQLLVVSNFDNQPKTVTIKILPHALETLGVPRPVKIRLRDLNEHYEGAIGTEELVSTGLELPLAPYGYYVLEMTY